VVVVLHVGSSKASCIKLILQRELRTGNTWFLAEDETVDAAICELFEETRLTLIGDDLTMFSNKLIRV
jgi:hypothetical protein